MTNTHPLPSPPDFKMSGYAKEYINQPLKNTTADTKDDILSMPLSPQTPPLQPTDPKDSLPPLSALSKLNTHSLSLSALNIIHDSDHYMFKIKLDSKGNTAALCYLPTRYRNIIEFYHIEIPVAYRQQGLGDLLLYKAFQWVEKSNLLVIPTCPFVRKYLEARFPDQKSGNWSYIALHEQASTKLSSSPSS
ncbi:GCN5-related N-acetyl-transferase-domain-containing protein [Choanephora cucurbitarum]|nr:GCN5-related N-acetyl-transferase-domain-containing protein [Choanephora cucurbitarum]